VSDPLIEAVLFSGIGSIRSMSDVLTEGQAKQVMVYLRQVQNGSSPVAGSPGSSAGSLWIRRAAKRDRG